MRTAAALGLLVFLALAPGCGRSGGGSHAPAPAPPGPSAPAPPPPAPGSSAPTFDAAITVTDEAGAPLAGATVTVDGVSSTTGADGRVVLAGLTRPVLAVVDATGFLSEPLALGPAEAQGGRTVRLLAATGPHGERRVVMHFAGDTMLGRRYEAPTRPDTALVTPGDGGASARAVVSAVAPLFGAADIRSLNLETVVGTLPTASAYPKKRFLLQSPPEVLRALGALGANLVTLANNHSRDWLEDGVTSTTANLDGAGLPHPGAGLDAPEAADAAVVNVASMRVGFLAYTTVNGDFVNDSLPLENDPVPAGTPPSEMWQYDRRVFGFTGPTVSTPPVAQRIGTVWRFIVASEAGGIGDAERASLWTAATAVFPELQDWVARRGHGGANSFSGARMAADVATLRGQGCDLVIVAFHAGLQFCEVKSVGTEIAAHAALDAGADLVVAHHPHVLQGLEWYKGRLVAYSLGNFVFDQDFLATFTTVVLRVVFEEKRLLEARVLPVALDRYRPVPLVGAAARDVVRTLAERSGVAAHGDRVPDASGVVGVHALLAPLDPSASAPGFALEGASGRLLAAPPSSTALAVSATADRASPLAGAGLTRGGPAAPDLLFGRDVFRWGSFEVETCDTAAPVTPTVWTMNGVSALAEYRADAPDGVRVLHLSRTAASTQRVIARSVARVTLPTHRLFALDAAGTAQPADGPATYSVRLFARLDGHGAPFVRLEAYYFDGTNPTEDPTSTLLRTLELPVPVPEDGAWHEVLLDIPASFFSAVGPYLPDMVLPYVGLAPLSGDTDARFDGVQFLEWRAARSLPDGFYLVDAVRAQPGAGATSAVLERQGD
jgi:poly-gamma-glutamate capsule biosynthesis protein CapA/YwtB (metallophosphatase superfamily)